MTQVNLSRMQQMLYDAVIQTYPDTSTLSRAQVRAVAERYNIPDHHVTAMLGKFKSVSRGVYNMTMPRTDDVVQVDTKTPPQANAAPDIHFSDDEMNDDVFVPTKLPTYVQWGHAADVHKIIASKYFFPIFITGLSGNGKTMMVEQSCAKAHREYIRVQINPETDEDDLIGGFRLINGETVFEKGPVIRAMEAGAILLIDEVDRGSNKLMAIQGVLEGKPVLIKKTGEVVRPKPGFNVIATANTKGYGSDDGKFVAATVIDDAFLERFTVTFEQPYPDAQIEQKIVAKHMKHYGVEDDLLVKLLTSWSGAIRKTFQDGGVEDTISTRRLCHIVQTYSIFNDRKKAVELCVSRFDDDTKAAFLDLYTKIDASTVAEEAKKFGNANKPSTSRRKGPVQADPKSYVPF